jgi:hypothetical protein
MGEQRETASRLVCAECGAESDEQATGWRALLLSNDELRVDGVMGRCSPVPNANAARLGPGAATPGKGRRAAKVETPEAGKTCRR